MPFLQDLYERTHETVHLGIREGQEVVYIAKIGGRRQARAPSRAGGRMPLHCTAIGKALLAFGDSSLRREVLTGSLERRTPHTVVAPGLLRRQLAQVVKSGVAFEYEESAPGINCVAAPVFGPGNELMAALSLTGPTSRFRPGAHSLTIRAAASALTATLTSAAQ
ncbi:IclR family transcriptional regulator [Nocardioides sp. S5]|uniref:IclR family transcriptional regulator n=1 Tax=Nocardioides sp. S5 TaxID=2017486 RepID=UPI001F5CB253|nr:IclR family transcriptional regulator [Nocardioides sp. S5]